MKTTITTTGGKGRPKNPYETLDKIYTEVYNHFERTVQQFPCYLDGKPFMGKYDGEAEVVWQFQYSNVWADCTDNDPYIAGLSGRPTRQILAITPPVEANESNHFYLNTKVGPVHVNMNPNADKETFEAVQSMAEKAYHMTKNKSVEATQTEREKTKVVCYCGSLRVALEAFKKAEYEAVLKGEIALLPCCMFVDIQREYGAESDYKVKADYLHKRKIDICDEVFVLNVDGYIGDSTKSEIMYALSINKPVKYLDPEAFFNSEFCASFLNI